MEKVQKPSNSEYYATVFIWVEISNRFAALEILDIEVDVNKAWETIRENIKISVNYYTKENKPNCNGYRIQAK
jgi:hypothetical protein